MIGVKLEPLLDAFITKEILEPRSLKAPVAGETIISPAPLVP